MAFYFAWVNNSATTFDPAYARTDEDVYSFEISHREGEYPLAVVTLRNTGVGLVGAGRMHWAWISMDSIDSAGVEPLFFGRIQGVPTSIDGEFVQVMFRARPKDVNQQKEALAAGLKRRPYYDPIWIKPEMRDDPDTMLEMRPVLWHYDRVSPVVTTSNIIDDGHASDITLTKADYYADSLGVAVTGNPLRRLRIEAEVHWTQRAVGDLDVSRDIINAFKAAGTRTKGVISSFTGAGLGNDWPRRKADIGSGWSVKSTRLRRVDGKYSPKVWLATHCQYRREPEVLPNTNTNGDPVEYDPIDRFSISSTDGATTGTLSYGNLSYGHDGIADPQSNNGDAPVTLRFGLWEYECSMVVRYDVERQRTEKLVIVLEADVQEIGAPSDDDQVEVAQFSSIEITELVDEDGTDSVSPIRDPRRSQFFTTARGSMAIDALMSFGRSRMRARARCIEVTVQVPFETATRLSCRQNATIETDALVGGSCTGKVVAYSFSVDGTSGEKIGSLTIACAAGRGTPTTGESSGGNEYVEDGYVEEGYFRREGVRYMPFPDELWYEPPSDPVRDDGVDFFDMSRSTCVLSCTVTNGEAAQVAVLNQPYRLVDDAIEALNNAYTEVSLVMKPLDTGPFKQTYRLNCSTLSIPKNIDFED